MYYEESIINDVLCTRGTPDGEWIPLSPVALTTRLAAEVAKTKKLREALMPFWEKFMNVEDGDGFLPDGWVEEFESAYLAFEDTSVFEKDAE